MSIVIGTLGTMLERTNESLKRLKLTKHRAAFQMTAIKGSVSILNSHLRRDDSAHSGYTKSCMYDNVKDLMGSSDWEVMIIKT